MAATLRHISITAQDLGRCRAFYEAVMGWQFAPWGPPDVLQISGPGVGALLHTPVTVGGKPLPGIELSFATPDLDAVAAAVKANGGSILAPPYHLEGIGTMIRFEDPDREVMVAMAYEREFAPTLVDGAAQVRHFAINATDVPRSRRFYEEVFGWEFTPWGPPDFYQTRSAGAGRMGALQGRRDIAGRHMPGIELSFSVDDVKATVAAIEANGGQVLMPPFHIAGVGSLTFFQDPEGNIAGAMQYEAVQWPE